MDDPLKWLLPRSDQAKLDDDVVTARMDRSSDDYAPYSERYLAMVLSILRNASYCKIAGIVPHDENLTGPQEEYDARMQRLGGNIPGFDTNSGWSDDWKHRHPVDETLLPEWPLISHRYVHGHVHVAV